MSSSWKSQGRSFNSLVKRNPSGVDIRANDRNEFRSDRDAIQIYNLPDASGTGIDAGVAESKFEFGKCAFGVEASNNFIFNDAFFGIDSSANIQFTDVSGGLGRVGFFFRKAVGDTTDKAQNIFFRDASGESLLIRLRPFWNPYNEPASSAPGSVVFPSQDPSWNYPPGEWGTDPADFTQIGCPTPLTPAQEQAGNKPARGGTLGAVTIDVGGGNSESNVGSADVAAFMRARQLAKAIGNPFEPDGTIGGISAVNNTGYFWSDYEIWKNRPTLDIASSQYGIDSSTCIVWQTMPKDEPITMPGAEGFDVSYNPVPLLNPAQTYPLIHWTEALGAPEGYQELTPPLTVLTDISGTFFGGQGTSTASNGVRKYYINDISQNITLTDTSGETLKFILDVDASYNTIDRGSDYNFIPYDPSWNTVGGGSLGTMTLPFGNIFLDWKVGERNALRIGGNQAITGGIEDLNDLQRPTATDRANTFIRAINRTGWGADVSANGYYLEIGASTNPYDTSGGVILTQDYGGVSGNTAIEYDPDYIDTSHNGLALPTDVSANRPANDPSSNYQFGGGVNDSDISQNIILSDICGNRVQFVLNVDKTFVDPSFVHLANDTYNINQMDISSVIVPMDNSSNRATGAERAEMMAKAINKTNFDEFSAAAVGGGTDVSSVDLFLVGTTEGGNKLQIYQEYPGVSGNLINIQVNTGPPLYKYPDISYNTPTWDVLFNPSDTNQDSSSNYPLKLQRNMDSSGGFINGQDPIDASQSIVLTASGEFLTTLKFYLDVDRQYAYDASGAHEIGQNSYEYFVPVGKGLGMRTSEILVSDKMRADRFRRAFDECSKDPSNIPVPHPDTGWDDPSGGGSINFLELKTLTIQPGSIIYNIDTENVPLPTRMAATIGGGGQGGFNNSPYPPYPPTHGSTTQYTQVHIESINVGAGTNQTILYDRDPNEPGNLTEGYEVNKFYPLIEKTSNNVIYNEQAISGAVNARAEYDKIVRTQNQITIIGGRHTLVLGDQDKNEIIIESIIDISGDQLSIPVWELGKGAGTANINTKYSIQAINPSNSSGVTGAGADYAIAGGYETRALGESSVSFGTWNLSRGKNSFTMGESCETSLSAEGSNALGINCTCNNENSIALGYYGETGLTTAVAPVIGIPHNITSGTGEVVFAIGSKTGPSEKWLAETGATSYNIFEVDTGGNIWSQALGNLSATVTPILRTDAGSPPTSGLYVDYGNAPSETLVSADGDRSFAMGYGSSANAQGSFVDGSGCEIELESEFSAIFGEDNMIGSTGEFASHSFVAGKGNTAKGKNSAIFGENCTTANYSFAAGSSCDASGDYSVAIGVNNQSPGFYSVALGGANYAFGESSLALGRNSRALGVISAAIGCHSVAQGGFSVAIGRECNTGPDASNSYCFGANCTTTGIGSIALGFNSISDGKYSFVGSGGYAHTDASSSIAIGYGTRALKEGAVSIGYDSSANFPYSIAIGKECDISGSFAVGLGFQSQCGNDYSFAVGKSCLSQGTYAVAFGKESSAYYEGSTAIGINCLAKSCRVKEWDSADAQTSIALGKSASTSNYAAWVGTYGSDQEPKDNSSLNAPTFRGSKQGIVLAIGANGNAIEYAPNIGNNAGGTYTAADSGNIFEVYGDGTFWTSSMGVVVNPADASAVKMVFAIRGENTTPLIKVDAGNHEQPGLDHAPIVNEGIGAVIVGNDSQAIGNYSFSSGQKNRTDASYCVAMGYDCSAQGISSFAMGYECDASNNYSTAFGYGGSTKESSSGGDLSDNKLVFAIGVSAEFLGDVLSGGPDPSNIHYSGNVFEVDQNGSVWTKALGTLSSTIPALGAVPIGGIIPFAGSQSLIAPTNWLWCDGQTVNHVNEPKYAPLFLVIGTTYGAASGPGGFMVPNLQLSWPMGNVDMGTTLTDPNDPNQTGDAADIGLRGATPAETAPIAGTGAPLVMRWLIRYT